MPTRSPDPRRTPRGGTGQPGDPGVVVPLRGGSASSSGSSSGGLSAARRYTPRGRTVREAAEGERSGRRDPFRPALQVVDSGERRSSRAAGGNPPRQGSKDEAPAAKAGTAKSGASRTGATKSAAATGRSATGRSGSVRSVSGKVADRSRVRRPAAGKPGTAPRRQVKPRLPRQIEAAAPPRLGEPKRRLRFATVLALAMFTLVVGRLVQIQLTDARSIAAAGLTERLAVRTLPAARGSIIDRNGAILVHSVEARYISVDPTRVKDPEATATKLFEVLGSVGVTRSDIVEKSRPHKLNDGTKVQFEYLARSVDVATADKVAALGLRGVEIGRDETRVVPNRDLAANVLGYTRTSDHAGLTGLELNYDDLLRGVDGKRRFEIGGSGMDKEIPGGYVHEDPARPGKSLQLTLDQDMQYEVQLTLTERMQEVQATFGAAVVLDVSNGEVLAQASYPSYDAAKPGGSTADQQRDTCTQVVFDPGSVHKALVVGAALEEGVITPDSTVAVEPEINKGGTTYKDSHPQKAGTAMTLPGILALSSNVGTIKIADKLGKDKLYDYQRRFGLGQKTGVGTPNEASGALLEPGKWSGSSYGSIPIGDGVATTAMQMAGAYATIANDGVYIQPHLVQSVVDANGRKNAPPAPQTRRVLSAEHASQLRTMLEAVTTLDGATGKSAAIEGYRVAGKTGTGMYAQGGGYAPGNVASFIGMAPADAPRYLVAVVAYVPTGTGGTISGPAFQQMMSFALVHYQVRRTGTQQPTFSVYP